MKTTLEEDISNLEETTSNFISVFDVVRNKRSGKIGLVTEAAEEFGWYDSSLLSPDQIEVLWENDTNRECINRNDVLLVNKGLLVPGSFVASSLDPSGQTGVAIDVTNLVDLLTPNGDIIKSVDTKELIQVKDFSLGSMVVLGSWIGLIVDIIDNVTVLFDNGLVSEFKAASETSLQPIEEMIKIAGSFPNYPGYYSGQRVKARFRSVFYKNPRFLPGLWKPEILEGTVMKVSVESVCIDWYCYAEQVGDELYTKPDENQNPEYIKKLPFFDHVTWVLFARCLLKDFEGVLKIINVKKKVDVAWQDGTLEKQLDSANLIVKNEDTSHFFPEQFVRRKSIHENNEECESRSCGIVKSVDSKEKTALVRWQPSSDESRDVQESDEEEEVSIYEIEIHPERNYFFGDLVGEVATSSVESTDLPQIGCITGMENGNLNVSWINGSNSEVVPEDIFKIESPADVFYNYYDDYNVEMEEVENFFGNFYFVLLEAIDLIGALKMLYFWGVKHLNFNFKLTSIDTELQFERILCNSSSKNFDVTEDPLDHYFVGMDEQAHPPILKDYLVVETLVYHAHHQGSIRGAQASKSNNAKKKWLKKVQEDWRILQNDLPDGIFVRVYEDRMDLLRVMIVGPYGTPYQDGLYFFDFHLPPEYPDVPPTVHYYSGGWRINPNLYEDGKICLSLLNTWHGEGTEIWDPSSSTILQVLVSIQGLILNSKPYFNEAGYDKLIGTTKGEKDSSSYNENTYLLNCKKMMHSMRHPLKGFEELMREHFVGRGFYILKACDAYLKGYLIGSLTKDASPSTSSKPNVNSIGFKRTLGANIIPKLFFALNEIGADCNDFQYLVQP